MDSFFFIIFGSLGDGFCLRIGLNNERRSISRNSVSKTKKQKTKKQKHIFYNVCLSFTNIVGIGHMCVWGGGP